MMDFVQHYNFLTLSLVFTLPGATIWLLRPDLRRIIVTVSAFALPFACTEFLFYPDYWKPNFLFDLGTRIGFGIEDIIFICGVAAFTSTLYAFVFNRGYKPALQPGFFFSIVRVLGIFIFSGLIFFGAIIAGVAVIYATFLVMAASACSMMAMRRDLVLPSLLGAVLTTVLYFILCITAEKIIPGLFITAWHTQNFLNIFIAGVPAEELLYGFFAGLIGTAFYPYVFSRQFTKRTP